MLSGRVPGEFEPNEVTRLLRTMRGSGVDLFDLAETNPVRLGLTTLSAEIGAALLEGASASYEPDPRGLSTAREAIVAYYRDRSSAVALEDLVLVASTSEAYAHLFRLLCNPGDEIAAPRPSYPLFAPLAQLEGVGLPTYRLAYDRRWRLDRDSLEAAIGPRTRAVIIVSPNNPTGSCLSPEEIDFVESLCAERGLALIADEVFGDFPWPPRTEPLPTLLGARRVPTIVLNGLSKLCGLPHLKLAWMAVAGPEPAKHALLEGLEWISDLFLSVATPVQVALPRLLASRAAFHARVTERIRRNLATLAAASPNARSELLAGDGGWSAVVRSRQGALSEVRALDRRVLVHPGHFYDLDDSCFVVSLLPDPARFEEGLRRVLELV